MPDINDLYLSPEWAGSFDEATEGADEQFFAPPAPPDDGKHQVTLKIGRDGVGVARQRQPGEGYGNGTGALYLKIPLELRGAGGEKFVTFDRVTSIKLANSGTSRIRAILAAVGSPAPSKLSLPDLKAHIEAVMQTEPSATVW